MARASVIKLAQTSTYFLFFFERRKDGKGGEGGERGRKTQTDGKRMQGREGRGEGRERARDVDVRCFSEK